MATIEAMAAGLPVLGNRHPTSIVEHGVNGFVSDDPGKLREYARLLLDDRKLALWMDREARRTVRERFPAEAFRSGMERAIHSARTRWESRVTCGLDLSTADTGPPVERPRRPVEAQLRIAESSPKSSGKAVANRTEPHEAMPAWNR